MRLIFLLAAAIAAAFFLLRSPPTEDFSLPPVLEGRDPAIVSLVEKNLQAVAADPVDAGLWMRLGYAYEANDLDSLSLKNYRKALSLDQQRPRWWYRLARVQMRLGDRAAAVTAIGRAIALEPEYAPAHWRLGFLHLDQGELDPARCSFERAIEADPGDPAGRWGLARVLLQQNQPAKAAQVLEALAGKGTDYAYTHLLLGTAYRQLGRWPDARSELRRGAGGGPVLRDEWDEAIHSYRTGLLAEFTRAARLVDTGRLEAARVLLQKLRRQYPDNAGVLKKLGVVYQNQRLHEKALEAFKAAALIRPDDVDLQLTVASIYAGLEDPARALEHLERVLAQDSAQLRAYEGKGAVLATMGKYQEAIEAFEQGLSYDPHDSSLLLRLGRSQSELGRWEAALASFLKAAELDSNLAPALVGIGKAARKLGDLDAAAGALERAAVLDPGSPRIGNLLEEVRQLRAGEGKNQ
jgi:superkiller protein 3